ncbi:heme biosynthesis protein [Pseudoalteromonas rubra]|uniref:Heme biosynthesis protein n=1 Tax=Pseudoalteromonas rubra TaxID=43658 RepID=A0A5S3WN84_9GAMM|nr:radical SAM protein [Pseudoalteromonas rubra]TMP29642.1 heme biosynthesis protein [Pseudoalteromonas rubra]TMP35235.1 heme biosynthesis protein [Pseudoalteromonas rubra]
MTDLTHRSDIRINAAYRQTYAVWEITLKCNLACNHCGSRAGDARVDELSTSEALDLVAQMADLGIKEVTLIGGEAFMRPDWLQIAAEITKKGMKATMTTGGYGISLGTAKRMKEAGIAAVSLSIDGMERSHDLLRGKQGAWQKCFETIAHLREAGIPVGCNSQVNRESIAELPSLYEELLKAGISAWQLALTVPMGNAVENSHILLQPYELLDVFPLLAYLSKRGNSEGIRVHMGNNIGYFGPYERLLKEPIASEAKWAFTRGCSAGQNAIGIEADGSIKGCPSLPSDQYTGGNIRDRKLQDIYQNSPELRINDITTPEDATRHLWGECSSCEFASVCRAGCHWTAHVFFGKRGNNPYCHHRALKKAAKNQRERFYVKQAAPGKPFDHGVFAIHDELCIVNEDSDQFRIDNMAIPARWQEDGLDLLALIHEEKASAIESYRSLVN